ncbi:bcl-2 homologous antagonist/killer [Latimeria chalumnae]|nr:PREDICTED: bcl-2 homologous antagonist/killer isoform X2 [Latimeria chalumnae]|eukprot:XP_005995522.1 PREDICTED: bcl-2 homologous antagonist/killer isoform X2 [Latimeria chalumnae]
MSSEGGSGDGNGEKLGRTPEKDEPLSRHNTVQDVVRETEEVFLGYVQYRYQQEREQNIVQVPDDYEINQIEQEPNSMTAQVGQRLAIIGDDINKRYDREFTAMLSALPLTMENAYSYFQKIAEGLFDSGINWGRVIALLGFGYRMALHVYRQGFTGFLTSIAQFVSRFLLQNRIAQWIAQQGGWVAALDLDNVYMKYLLAILGVVLIGHFVLRRFFNH